MTNQNLIEIVAILDRSGSMSSVRDDAIGGFNTFVDTQRELPGETNVTVVLFDDRYDFLYNGVDIKKVEPLTTETYVPRGMTALLDAIGRTISSVGERLAKTKPSKRPSKVLVAILTDGQENSSHEYTREKVFDMIEHQRNRYSWEFVFLAANQDAITTGQSLGVHYNQAFAATPDGTRTAYAMMSASAVSFRTTGNISFDGLDLTRFGLTNATNS